MDKNKLSLFMIEDSQVVISEHKSLMGKSNDIEVAESLHSAREKLRENKKKYDCLIVDMSLPDGWGYEIIKEIRNDEGLYNKDTKIIVYSSYLIDYEVVQNAFKNGANHYIQKSLDYENFEPMLRGFLAE
jgi:DNA-binding NarL/FixJ family response regulator